ncbi:SRPBCC family protein [Actinoallomurus iriomotensis]|uniref:Polyketide cyclase / dehydrase and lipid transport n=1 Tax=Actinoallomurus iriomotensis TaxID=478107 RepID=A0A9W6VT60_9ACTN|nr:SRPBCC family protein [Actinoallomurus iriomotensis]GLY79400.1 hypothetical protein Airi01_076670 [Actinoallomurus iriomotensis]
MRTLKHIERLLLDVPIEDAYEFISDPRNDIKWYRGVTGVRLVSEADDVYEQSLTMLGLRYRARIRVSDPRPPHRVVLSSVDSRIPFTATYIFESVAPGRTRFTMDATVTITGVFLPLGPLFILLLRRRVGRNFIRLGQILGAEESQTA